MVVMVGPHDGWTCLGHDSQKASGGLESEGKVSGLAGGQSFVRFALVACEHILLFMLSIPMLHVISLFQYSSVGTWRLSPLHP